MYVCVYVYVYVYIYIYAYVYKKDKAFWLQRNYAFVMNLSSRISRLNNSVFVAEDSFFEFVRVKSASKLEMLTTFFMARSSWFTLIIDWSWFTKWAMASSSRLFF